MEKLSLDVMPRSRLGKGNAGRLRRAGHIPGIVYGKDVGPVSLSVQERDLRACIRRGLRLGRLVELTWSDGRPAQVAVLRDLQRDPVTSRPIHLDFQIVLPTQPLAVEVPVVLEGTPVGVREEGGHLEQHVWRVKVRSLPDRIPDRLVLDVSRMHAGDTLHVRDFVWSEGTILTDSSLAVASVTKPRVEAASAAAATEGEAAAEEGASPAGGA